MTKRQPEPQAIVWGLQAPTSSPAGDFCGEGAGPSGACLGHPGLCPVSGSPLQSPGVPGAGEEGGPWTSATGDPAPSLVLVDRGTASLSGLRGAVC